MRKHHVFAQVGEDGLNLLINNAGVLPKEEEEGISPDMMKEVD